MKVGKKIEDFEAQFGKKLDYYTYYKDHDLDMVGQISKLSSDDFDKITDEDRQKLIVILKKILEPPHTENYDANFYFNAATHASRLDQHKIASQLAEIAFQKEKSAPHQARFIRLRVAAGNREAIPEMKKMIEDLSLDRPEIVLAEAWNVAETTATYQSLIKWLEDLIKSRPDGGSNEKYIPSYAYITLAQSYLRWGAPGSEEKANSYIKKAFELHRTESPMSSWYDHTVRDYRKIQIMVELKRAKSLFDNPFSGRLVEVAGRP